MLLSEINQSEKATYYMIPTIRHSGKGKTVETIKRSMVVSEKGEIDYVEHRGFLGQ